MFATAVKAECRADRCSKQILEGELAPYTGQILSIELAVDYAVMAADSMAKAKIERRRGERLLTKEKEHTERMQKVDTDAWVAKENLYKKKIEDQPNTILWAAIAFVGGLAVAFGSVKLAKDLP